jgi:hypothetical protein
MSEKDEKKNLQNINNVIPIDHARLKRLLKRGNYISMLEQFDLLRIKFMYDELTKEEAIKFVTMCKYFMNYGHTESIKLVCYYLYKKYIEHHNL